MGVKAWLSVLVSIAAMVMECLDVGLVTLSKAAMSRGMNHFVFVVYYNALASLILFLLSFVFHRTKRPPLTFSHLCKFFLLGLPGSVTLSIQLLLVGSEVGLLSFVMGIAAIMGVIFLGETLHIGSVVGAIIIATGCYGVALGTIQRRGRE